MKFRDPKTGKVFEKLDPMDCYWHGTCDDCPLSRANNGTYLGCAELMEENPTEAARRMGLEVLFDGVE